LQAPKAKEAAEAALNAGGLESEDVQVGADTGSPVRRRYVPAAAENSRQIQESDTWKSSHAPKEQGGHLELVGELRFDIEAADNNVSDEGGIHLEIGPESTVEKPFGVFRSAGKVATLHDTFPGEKANVIQTDVLLGDDSTYSCAPCSCRPCALAPVAASPVVHSRQPSP
jgi:hypothetical protein